MTNTEAEQPAKPKPTVASVAEMVEELNEATSQNNRVGELQAAKIATLQQEVKALGVLVNNLKGAPGDAVKPSKLDNVLARLEKLETSARGEITDYTPVIKELSERSQNLAQKVEQLASVVPGESGVAELQAQVDQLEARLARAEHDGPPGDLVAAPVHEALADRIDDAHKRIDSLDVDGRLDERIRRIVANRASFEQDLLARLENLEHQLPQWERAGGSLIQSGSVATPVMGVHAKMLALMDEVTAISKDRRASGGGVSFKFRGVEDAQNAVGQAQRKVRILILPEVVSWEYGQEHVDTERDGKVKTVTWATSRLTMRYVFVDPDDGSRETVTMVGEGKDNSDKSASKAASMACKYALFQALMIPFEDVDESDKQADARAEDYRPHDTPGARVNRGEISAAQAAHEYHQQARQAQAQEMTPLQKAATLVEWVKKGMAQPVEQALKTVQTAMERSTAAGLNDLEVEGIPVRVFLTTSLQSVSAALNERAASAGAQGMTRQEQQAGQGARAAAATPQHPVRNPSVADFEDALLLLDRGDVPPEVHEAAQQTVNNFEESTAGAR